MRGEYIGLKQKGQNGNPDSDQVGNHTDLPGISLVIEFHGARFVVAFDSAVVCKFQRLREGYFDGAVTAYLRVLQRRFSSP
jgi:hypothetical protein